VGDEEGILKVWKEYFDELLNEGGERRDGEETRRSEDGETQTIEKPPTIEDIRETIKQLENGKSPGSDSKTTEIFKYEGETVSKYIQKVIKKIWIQEIMPQSWREAMLIPLFKKGDRTECQNYRGIALLNVGYKISATNLKNKLIRIVEK
jgi:hypothetical protein